MAPGKCKNICNNESYLKSIQTRDFGAGSGDLFKALQQLTPANIEYESNSKNPADGNFERAVYSLKLPQRFLNWLDDIASHDLPNPGNIRTLAAVSAMRLYLWYIQTKGRFHSELKQYGQAAVYNNLAKRIYEALFDRSMRDRCIEPLCGRANRQIINHGLNNRINRRQMIEFLHTKGKAPIAMLKLGYAELLQSIIRADLIVPDAWVERTVSPKELRASIGGRLVGPLGTVRKKLLEAWGYSKYVLTRNQRTIQKKIKRAQDRVNIVAANHLLESAKRLKIKNHALALKVINMALKLCTGSKDLEVRTSSELTKAWAYSSQASLKDERERGSGQEEAFKAAKMYKRIYETASGRILRRLAMSRLEIYLNHADNLKLAQKYKDAISAYKRVLGGGHPARPIVYDRARLGIISTQVAKANYDYFKKGNSAEVLTVFEKASNDARDLLKKIERKAGNSYTGKQYRAEVVKLKDTLAWAEASKGRIERSERGGGKKYFEEAKKLYAEISESLDLNTQIESGLTYAQLAMRQGDINKDLKNYKEALQAYRKIKSNDIIYVRGRLSIMQVVCEMVKRVYPKSGELQDVNLKLEKLLLVGFSQKLTETEKLSHKLLLSQIYGTLGWLKTQSLQRGQADRSFGRAVQILEDELSRVGKMEYKDRTALLDNVYQAPAQLRLSIAELQRVAGERDQNLLGKARENFNKAIRRFKSLPTTHRSFMGVIQAEVGLLETYASFVKLLVWEHKYKEAKELLGAVLGSNKLKQLVRSAGLLKRVKHHKMLFRFYSAFALLLGVSGGLKEKMEGEGAGREYFERARRIYSKYIKGVASPDLLSDSEIPETNFPLTEADILKAEGIMDKRDKDNKKLSGTGIRTLIKAFKAYQAIIKTPIKSDSPLGYYSKNNKLKAGIGAAESLLAIGKHLEEEKQPPEVLKEAAGLLKAASVEKHEKLAERAYKFASRVSASTIRAMVPGGKAEDLPRAAIGLKAIKALTGALGSLGNIRENSPEMQARADDELLIEYKIALYILHLLLKRNGDQEDKDFKKIRKGLKTIVGFIEKHKDTSGGKVTSVFTDPEVYFNTETSPWNLPFSYIGFQIAARRYGGAIRSCEEIQKSFATAEFFTVGDRRFLADIYSSMGDLYAFRLREYEMAEKFYRWAKQQISSLPPTLKKVKKVQEVQRRILFGEGKILIQDKKYDEALAKYDTVLKGLDLSTDKIKEQKHIARAYLSKGDLYAYHLDDSQKAWEFYKKARDYLSGREDVIPLRSMLAQSYLGIGDVYRLPKLGHMDYRSAMREYQNGVNLVRDLSRRDSRKVLSQLYLGIAECFKKLGGNDNRKKAEELIKLARQKIKQKDAFDLDRKDIEDRIEFSYVDLRREGFEDADWSAFAELHSVSGRFLEAEESGEEWVLGVKKQIGKSHRVGFSYSLSDIERTINFENGTRERLKGGEGHFLDFNYRYFHEGRLFNFNINPSFRFGFMDFNTFKYKWGRNYPAYEAKYENEHRLYTFSPRLVAGAEFKWQVSPNLLLMPTVQFDGSYMVRNGENAGITKQINEEEKPKDKRKEVNLDNSNLGAAYGRWGLAAIVPHLRLGERFMLSNLRAAVGGSAGIDSISATGQGFWQLDDDIPLVRTAFTMDFGVDINFSSDYRWMLFADSHHEIGQAHHDNGNPSESYNYHQARLGVRWYPTFMAGIEFYLGGAHFGLGDNQSSGRFFAGLRFNF